MNEIKSAQQFTQQLLEHAQCKAALYDGSKRDFSPDMALRLATEELGEVAGAITRSRWRLAEYECIDLAHTAFLLWRSILAEQEPNP